MRHIPTVEPIYLVATGVCGPLSTTQNGNKYICEESFFPSTAVTPCKRCTGFG